MRTTRLVLAAFAVAASLAPDAAAHSQIEVAAPCGSRLSARAWPVGTGDCGGVRPGAYFESRTSGCTLNFLFRGDDGYDGRALAVLVSLAADPTGNIRFTRLAAQVYEAERAIGTELRLMTAPRL